MNLHLTPRPELSISFIPYIVNEKERYVIKVAVCESAIKPVILKINGIPSIYMRREGFTNGATYEEICQMSIKSAGSQYDIVSSDEKYRREDFTELFKFYLERNDGKELTDKALRSMGFYDEKGFLSRGAQLFKNGYDEGKTTVQCSLFNGFTRGSGRIVTITKFSGNLQGELTMIMEFLELRMNHMVIKQSDGRVNVDAYPHRALFEGIVNALVHRDYYLDGTQIQIDMFRDRLEISSPGSFYRGEYSGMIRDLSKLISKRRNELISSVLVSCNCMEAAGTGFDKIIDEYKEADENHKPFAYAASDHFTLILPDLTYDEGVKSEEEVKLTYISVPEGTEVDEKVLSYCFHKRHKVSEIAAHLGLSNSTYLRRNILGNLEARGYLISSKEGNAKVYKTNREAVSAD